jgi:hypothetical protein
MPKANCAYHDIVRTYEAEAGQVTGANQELLTEHYPFAGGA